MEKLLTTIIALLFLRGVAAAPNPQESAPLTTLTGSSATSSAATSDVTLTGQFTGSDGNAYEITSYSSMVIVAGHSLTVGGPDALVGNVIVTEASQGFVANGQNITMISITSSPSSAAAEATSESTSMASTTRGPAGQSPAVQPTGDSNSSGNGGAVMPMATGAVGAVVGGVLGAFLL